MRMHLNPTISKTLAGAPLALLLLAGTAQAQTMGPNLPAPTQLAQASATPALAAPLDRDPAGTFSFTLENDLFGGTDKYYTSGFLLSWRSLAYDPPTLLSWLDDVANPLMPSRERLRWGVALGQNIFTPDDTLRRVPDPKDRPYAGWLYGAVSLTSYTDTSYGTLELQVGVVGPSALGEQVQNNTHDFLGIDRVYGWDSQLKDEPGLNLVVARQWRYNRLLDRSEPRGLAVGVIPSLTGSLGTVQTWASAGAVVRIGSNLLADFGTPRIRPSLAGSAFFQPDGRWGWYLFGGAEGRAVAHDIFLDGGTFRDGPSVDKEPFVGDVLLGAALITPWARLSYTQVFRSKEFENQSESIQFGSITLAMRF
jgi:lipid A 3-O-deacylase